MMFNNHAIIKVPAGMLFVDGTYQRPLYPSVIKQIRQEFNPHFLGIIIGSRRVSGEHAGMIAITDGQHRVAAAKGLIDEFDCIVYEGLDVQQEADMFYHLNSVRRRVSAMEIFNAQLAKKDDKAQLIFNAVKSTGMKISKSGTLSKGNIGAIGALYQIYRGGSFVAITRTIRLIQRCWGDSVEAYQGEYLLAFAQIVQTHGDAINLERLSSKLQRQSPGMFLVGVRDLMIKQFGTIKRTTPPARFIYMYIIDTYNQGLKKYRLPYKYEKNEVKACV